MTHFPLILLSAIICVGALVATFMIGMKPEDKNYRKHTKKRMYILSGIYVVTFVPALVFTIIYFFMR
ncbi:hypothetical protein MM221_15645 [Salipaludibacillus sp. LMS25]|jgi:hypothetical protein|uniref:hypothetical protein n=1 Tax=Salipaludibacillus sp. LMS25 TaxID=2924031 RepID=UPI0020D0A12A|nr:hypothetical protein [Salipaludibacillus sp. LMS25]UTR14028.1 hypothetical protein MM221_15645 [Salipaludibacillus sp. LMS25]